MHVTLIEENPGYLKNEFVSNVSVRYVENWIENLNICLWPLSSVYSSVRESDTFTSVLA